MHRAGLPKAGSSLIACVALVIAAAAVIGAAPPGATGAPDDPLVRAAMLRVYFHGVDDDLAGRVLGPSAVPALRKLLAEHSFPRRDNVVAFLAHLDAGDATTDLLGFLNDPPAPVDAPEEDRALLLAPEALGWIAARGDRVGLDALMAMTADRSDGGPLAKAAARGRDPLALRGDLMEAALRGLAYSRAPQARGRLEGISRRAIRPDLPGRDLARAATRSLELLRTLEPRGAAPPGTGQMASSFPGGVLDGAAAAQSGPSELSSPGGGSGLLDTNTTLHDSRLDYVNHIKLTTTMDNGRLDSVLAEATNRAGTENYSDDVGCCIQVSRLGNGGTFGSTADLLDIIDDSGELAAVLTNSVARVKVVRQINYCGGQVSNVIGCAYVGNFGMALVRMTDLGSEAVLWIHEYGHNTGMLHSSDSRNIMYGIDTGSNNVLTQSQCNSYHTPASGAGITPVAIGVCEDNDLDGVRDSGDNCLNLYNPSQANTDGDAQGDECDPDDDNDLVLDGADCAPVNQTAWDLPGEATGLDLASGAGWPLLSWSPPAAPGGTPGAMRYDVILSPDPEDFLTGAACVESHDGPNASSNSAPPPLSLWSAEGGRVGGNFGASVASGDFNHDGRIDLLVGMPRLSNSFVSQGEVSVYPGIPGGISTSFSWRKQGTQELSEFGVAVAAADVNGDGYDDLLVGVPYYDDGLGGGGAVFVYHGSPTGPATSPALILGAGQAEAGFGQSVASAGDVNGDGYEDVIVGAPQYDDAFFNEGSAFVYLGSAAGLSSSPSWTASGGQDDAWFGYSVASAGRMTGGPYDAIIVGAPLYDNGESNEGRAFVYPGSASGPLSPAAWTFESDQALSELGRSVASAGDTNGDGYSEVVVGAPFFDETAGDEGKAWLFSGSAAGLSAGATWSVEGGQAGAMLGASVASAGDVSGDGLVDLMVGAPGYDDGLSNNGRLSLYLGGSTGLSFAPALHLKADRADAGFGEALTAVADVNGDGRGEILVGAPTDDNAPADEGWAFLYAGSGALQPPPGGIFYYLIRAVNVCGTGPLAFDSTGAPHGAALLCP
ncbi:MAG TPA: FG-GAP-like repeat-containing protein [Candidatus Polarisedimenticolia bacterium]|jgi:hypothetical protein